MKIGTEYKIEEAASKDTTRLALQYPNVQKGDDGGMVCVACNGNMLAVVPVDAEPNEVGPVPIDALKRSRKGKNNGLVVLVGDQAKTLDGVANAKPKDLPDYPNWRHVVPPKDTPVTFKVSLNPEFLHRLARAIGSEDQVTLTFQDDLSPIRVTGTDRKAFGVLMPQRVRV